MTNKYSIFDNLIEGVQVIDGDWRYVYVNAAVVQQASTTKEALLGYSMLEKYPGIEKTQMFGHIRECLSERKAKKFLNEFTFPDGRAGFFDLSIQPFEEHVLILSVDVTKQYAAQNALEKNIELLRLSQQLALLGSFEYNVREDKLTWSDTMFTIMEQDIRLGVPTREEVLKLVHPDDINAVNNIFRQALEKGTAYTTEYRMVFPGKTKHLRSIAEPVLDKDGNVERIQGCIQDITKKKNIQIALANRERNYRLLFEGIQESFIVHEVITDDSGKIVDLRYTEINPVTEKSLGKTREEIIGKTRSALIGPLDEETTEIIKGVLGGKSVRHERYLFSLDKWFDVFIYSPQPGQIATLNLDITTRKKAEHQLKQSNILLEERVRERTHEIIEALEREKVLNEMKSQFVTIASHEFRTPLTTLLSSAFLIEQFIATGQADRVNKHILRIKDSITNMTDILEDFLSLETLEQGKVTVLREKFDVKAFMLPLILKMNGVLQSGQHINYNHRGPVEIYTDQRLLRKIVETLLSNAIKYSNNDVDLVTDVSPRQFITTITDHGIGIPEEDKSRIFEMFFRGSNVSNIQGVGLGLNLAKRYVDLLGGSLSFTSKKEEGTSFTVALPAR